MKTNQISRYATALAIASIAVLVSSCGSGSGSAAVPGVAGIGGGGAYAPGQCVLALTQSLGFTATSAQISATDIVAQANSGYGTTTVSGGAFAQGYQYSNAWNQAASDAYVGLNLAATGGVPTTGYPTTGAYGYSLQGALTMTQLRWQTIVYELEAKYPYGYGSTGYGYGSTGYPTGYPTTGYPTTGYPTYASGQIPPNICISGLYSMDLIYGPGTIQGGYIILVLNTGDYIQLQF